MKSSRIVISRFMSSAEYSANNYYYYNGYNGNLNNNDKNNTLGCRGVLELLRLHPDLESLPFPLSEFYETYRVTKRHKATKPSHLVFAQHWQSELMKLCFEVNTRNYQQARSIAFIITRPKPREVIAADFRDRIVQTLFVENLLYHLERYEHPHSYSCRVSKGCLAAVNRLKELNDQYRGGYVCFLDIANHFMSIDPKLWTPKLQAFIDRYYDDGEARKATLKYLADAIYYNRPQDDCIRMSPREMWGLIPQRKSLFHSETGVPIGNVTSQTLSNFVTTPYLRKVESEGFDFSFYTDDIGIFTFDKARLLAFIPELREYLQSECGLTLHPDKVYFQHQSKGLNALGFRIKGNNITPSRRIVHNFHRLVDWLVLLDEKGCNLYQYRNKARARLNSYLGLLRWSHSFNLRKDAVIRLQRTNWRRIFAFPSGFTKVEIRPYQTREAYFKKLNKIRIRQSLKIA